jgi:hypothetical protein
MCRVLTQENGFSVPWVQGYIYITTPFLIKCVLIKVHCNEHHRCLFCRSTGTERRNLLQSILRQEDDNEEDEDEAPDDEVLVSPHKFFSLFYYLKCFGESCRTTF